MNRKTTTLATLLDILVLQQSIKITVKKGDLKEMQGNDYTLE